MAWQQLTFWLDEADAEAVQFWLENADALAITYLDAEDSPRYEADAEHLNLWPRSRLQALFPEDRELGPLLALLQLQFPQKTLRYECTRLEDQPWERVCMDQFQPQCFGGKLWICPSWHRLPIPDAIVVTLDPGLAFGTGTHPTTQLCLEWLAAADLHNKTVLDYGSGSGILGIAAAALGAKEVWLTDNDPQALEASNQNAAKNHLTAPQLNCVLPEHLPPVSFDIVIANILANPLIALAPQLLHYLKPGGKLILSGLLLDQVEKLHAAYRPAVLFSATQLREEWVRLEGQRQVI